MRVGLHAIGLCLLTLGVSPKFSYAQSSETKDRLLPFTQPPAQWADEFGSYRSPLRTASGDPVTTAEQWRARRTELRAEWMELMGQWPPLITRPEVEVLDRQQRENFQQLTICWCPRGRAKNQLSCACTTNPRPGLVRGMRIETLPCNWPAGAL